MSGLFYTDRGVYLFEVVGADTIKAVEIMKYLGIHIDAGLELETKLTVLFSRMRAFIRFKWSISTVHATIIYRDVYIPRVSYAAAAWYHSSHSMREKLISTQRRALRTITNAYRTTLSWALQILAGLLPLHIELGKPIKYRTAITQQWPRRKPSMNGKIYGMKIVKIITPMNIYQMYAFTWPSH